MTLSSWPILALLVLTLIAVWEPDQANPAS